MDDGWMGGWIACSDRLAGTVILAPKYLRACQGCSGGAEFGQYVAGNCGRQNTVGNIKEVLGSRLQVTTDWLWVWH